MNKDVNKFLHKYDIQARQSQMRKYKAPSYTFDDFKHSNSYDHYVHTLTVSAYELLISEEDFRRLIAADDAMEEIYHRWGPDARNYLNEAYRVLGDEARETRVRKSNPAVQKAWERYQMLLKIAGD